MVLKSVENYGTLHRFEINEKLCTRLSGDPVFMMNVDPRNTLIVFALKDESQGQFGDLNMVLCGVGKVNAAYHLMHHVTAWRQRHGKSPEMILNLGSAGSTHFKKGVVVNCTRFIQRDFDVTALGHAPYVTPFEDTPASLTNGIRFMAYPEGICGTGDTFVTSGVMSSWDVVDMEAYALAKVCQFENIPFGCLKYITDGADGHAAGSWEDALPDIARLLRQAVNQALC